MLETLLPLFVCFAIVFASPGLDKDHYYDDEPPTNREDILKHRLKRSCIEGGSPPSFTLATAVDDNCKYVNFTITTSCSGGQCCNNNNNAMSYTNPSLTVNNTVVSFAPSSGGCMFPYNVAFNADPQFVCTGQVDITNFDFAAGSYPIKVSFDWRQDTSGSTTEIEQDSTFVVPSCDDSSDSSSSSSVVFPSCLFVLMALLSVLY